MQESGSSGTSSAGRAAWQNPAASLPSPDPRAASGGVTWRAVGLAFFLLLIFAPAGFYGELVYGTTYTFASGVPSMGALVALFLITLVNGLVRRAGRAGLSRVGSAHHLRDRARGRPADDARHSRLDDRA